MTFVYPSFLWAFLLLLIPIVIHLFNFRRQRVVLFSDIRLLKELNESRKSGVKLRDLILLLLRLLAFSAIILAFAQPYFPKGNNQAASGSNYISVYVDNSLSTQSIGKNGILLDEALSEISTWTDQFSEQDKFHLITNDIKSHQQRFVSKREFLNFISQIEPSAFSRSLSKILLNQQEILKSAETSSKRSVIVTDFQKQTTDFENIEWDPQVNFTLYPLQAENLANIFIDSLYFKSPVFKVNRNMELVFRIQNTANTSVENFTVELKINNKSKGIVNVNIPAESYAEQSITFAVNESGWQKGILEINDNEIFFDDQLYFAFNAKRQISIKEITAHPENKRLSKLFDLDDFYQYSQVHYGNIKQNELIKNDMLILYGLPEIPSGLATILKEYVSNGGTIVVFPSKDAEIESYNRFFDQLEAPHLGTIKSGGKIKEVAFQDPFFIDIFEKKDPSLSLPSIQNYHPIKKEIARLTRSLFFMNDGSPFLTVNQFGNGKVYIQSVGLDDFYGEWHKTALFTSTFLRMGESASGIHKLHHFFGSDISIPLYNGKGISESVKLYNTNQEHIKIPVITQKKQLQLLLNGDEIINFLHQSGFYEVRSENQNQDSEPLMVLAFNYDRNESYLETYPRKEILEEIKVNQNTNIEVFDGSKGTSFSENTLNKAAEIWRILLILGIVFLLGEMLINKFWKV